MVSREEIGKVIDELLDEKGLRVIKCKPSYRPSVLKSFTRYAERYGFTMKSYKDKDIYNKNAFVTLYDPSHNTAIEFNKDFINENLIDFQNTGKKKINIEDIFEAYDQLPDKCKDATGLIKHTTDTPPKSIPNAIAWCNNFEEEELEFGVITMPAYYINDLKDDNGEPTDRLGTYDFVLAHESMHSRDIPPLTVEEKNVYIKKREGEWGGLSDSEEEIYDNASYKLRKYGISGAIDWGHKGEVQDFDAFDKYLDGYFKDRDYLNGDTYGFPNWLNKASDYGSTKPSENYAEFGAMVITGYKNPTNQNSRVRFDGEWMQYQEWARLHPYTVQSIVRDLYDEEPSIDDILADTVPTRYGEFGVKIEDL